MLLYDLTKKSINLFAHLIELLIAWSTLILAMVLIFHLIGDIWVIIADWRVPSAAISVRNAITEAFDVMIMVEIAQIFIRLEDKHRLQVALILDTAILFSVRESILALYSLQSSITPAEISTIIFVGLRIAFSFKRSSKVEPTARG